MAISKPRIFTIPASVPFLRTLIKAFMQGCIVPGFPSGHDPLALAAATIYLPTRRACRLARDLFLDAIGHDAVILPRIVPIGDVDEDEFAFAEAATSEIAGTTLALAEPLGGLERRMLLAELILQWAKAPGMSAAGGVSLVASSPASALALADDLARLMDDMTTRQVPWQRLDELVPEDVDEYWQKTLQFLKIAREQWPAILAERGAIEPAERRDRLIDAEAARLAARHDAPVIAAGSTGSMPATAKLLQTIASLPHGAVVLPGLDTDLDSAAWDLIAGDADGADAAHAHPQFAMQALLHRIGVTRQAVTTLAQPASHGREPVVSEALRPAAATDHWQQRLSAPDFSARADAAMRSITMIEAATAEEEALAIATVLREAADTKDRTAALVTPDRALARRVLAALARWNVAVDDSGGDALADTPAGVFARLIAEAALGGLAPVPALALLKHPLGPWDRAATAALERAILRGPRPSPGTAGLAQALATFRQELGRFRRREESELHRSDPRVELRDTELDRATALVDQLAKALAPLEGLPSSNLPFAEIAARHRLIMQSLGGMTRELSEAFDEIEASGRLAIAPREYSELFHAAISDRPVRRPEANVRVRIFGPLEARLQMVDRLVLGGLVEGVWPPETRADAWLSRPMRRELGLDLPERRIGLSAHDFAQALGAPEIVLTRSAKLDGAPTVASRFVQRLAAVAGEERWKQALARGEAYLGYARALDRPASAPKAADRPAPKPPLSVRPKRLSVTEIEHWLRDPYTIYAKHILKLAPLDAIDTPPGAADRGTVIHGAIGEFTQTYAAELPSDPVATLIALGEKHFAPLAGFPEARAFWWPRYLRIARWFAEGFEPRRRAGLAELYAEIRGEIELLSGEHPFSLAARADRIERRADGRYAIIDYKTGAPPTEKQVRTGLSPQLTLEAAILRGGGFKDIPAGASVAELVYVRLRGGNPAGENRPIEFKNGTPDTQADCAVKCLIKIATHFAKADSAYLSLVHPMWRTRYGDYDHLARVKEWQLAGEDDDWYGA